MAYVPPHKRNGSPATSRCQRILPIPARQIDIVKTFRNVEVGDTTDDYVDVTVHAATEKSLEVAVKAIRKEIQTSYGVVPWFRIAGRDYLLGQLSFSCGKFDMKIDPLRGVQDILNREAPWQTATREAKEESRCVLDLLQVLRDVRPEDVHDNLFHVRLTIGSADELLELLRAFDTNFPEGHQKETHGLVLVDPTSAPESKRVYRFGDQTIRCAKQICRICRDFPSPPDRAPRARLSRGPGADIATWFAEPEDDDVGDEYGVDEMEQKHSDGVPFKMDEDIWRLREMHLAGPYGNQDRRTMQAVLLPQFSREELLRRLPELFPAADSTRAVESDPPKKAAAESRWKRS